MDSEYYEVKKAHFQNLFKKEADEEIDLFLQYLAIEINREMLGQISNLKTSVEGLTESIYSRES